MISLHPCPVCFAVGFTIGKDKKGKTVPSCGHAYSFKGSKAAKMMDRQFVMTEYGMERKSK